MNMSGAGGVRVIVRNEDDDCHYCDVLVVGAGVSGLAAASTVLSKSAQQGLSLKVCILEATGQPGGRVCSTTTDSSRLGLDVCLENGAEWVHGESIKGGVNVVYEAIRRLDASLLKPYEKFSECYHLSEGTFVTHPPYWNKDLEFLDQFVENLWKYKTQRYKQSARHESTDSTTGEDDEHSVEDELCKQLSLPHPLREHYPYYHIAQSWLGVEYGTSLQHLGMRSLALCEKLWAVGEHDFLVNAPYFSTLVSAFQWEPILQEHVFYGQPVTSIDYSTTQHTSQEVEKELYPIDICCATGQRWRSRKVIIAVPVSQLKNQSIAFVPPLPPRTQHAIDRLRLDAGMKVHLIFSSRFWPTNVCQLMLRTACAFVWDVRYFKGNQSWTHGGETDAETVPSSFGADAQEKKAVLCCMITGDDARSFSLCSDADKASALLQELDRLFDGEPSKRFLTQHVMDWTQQPFIEGSYSFPTVGSYVSMENNVRRDLSKAITREVSKSGVEHTVNEEVLWIAGEAASHRHPSTVCGAVEAGISAATQAVKSLSASAQR